MWGHRGWEIGRLWGIPIVVHASWLLVFAFVTWTLATDYLPAALPGQSDVRYWAMGGVAALLLFVSVLLHELGHCWVALRHHIPIGRITLFVFGGVAHMRTEPATPRAEFLIAMAGPLVSFLLAGLWLGGACLGEAAPEAWHLRGMIVLGGLVGTVNLQIGLFNLIPGFPLDGGRALRAGLWAWSRDVDTATKRSAGAGLVVAVILICCGVGLMLSAALETRYQSFFTTGSWVAMIGLFLFATAKASRQHAVIRQALVRVPVRELMTQAVVAIPSDLTVETAVRAYFLPQGFSSFPVMRGELLVGLVRLEDVQHVPQSLWAWRTVQDVMRPLSPGMTVEAEEPALRAMELMRASNLDRVLVMDGERVVGLVTQSAIWRFLQLRAGLGE